MPCFHRVVVSLSLPTGSYDRERPVNAGNHLTSVNPYYAFTLLPTKDIELSMRLHFLWNSANDEPFLGLGVLRVQPGQALHANYALSCKVSTGLRLGLNGYALQQLTADRVDGHAQADSKERIFGIGPGLKFSEVRLSCYLNTYFESGAQNRAQGTKVILRVSRVF